MPSNTGNTIGGETAQSLTYGQKAVGLTFNPGGSEEVHRVKEAYAAIIDGLNDEISDPSIMYNSEKVRLVKIAITQAQQAQMWAVKAITWK